MNKNLMFVGFITMVALVSNVTSTETYTRSAYTEEELIRARLCWWKKEGEIERLKIEAIEYASQTGLQLKFSAPYGIWMMEAYFDSRNKMLTIPLNNSRPVVLTYQEFDMFIADPVLRDKAELIWLREMNAILTRHSESADRLINSFFRRHQP